MANLTTSTGSGLSGKLALGYNILGYVAVETVLSGHGNSLFHRDDRSWAGHWHTGLRIFPLWHWQASLPKLLVPLEPSFMVGYGLSYQGYVAFQGQSDVAWSRLGTWRFGLGLDYGLLDRLTLGLEYSFMQANYDKFIFNQREGRIYSVDPAASTGFHQLLAVVGVDIQIP